jgi:hypothetical protein
MWDNDYDFQWTLIDANHYYKTSFYEAKRNQQNPKHGKYKVVSHGYLIPKGPKSTNGFLGNLGRLSRRQKHE